VECSPSERPGRIRAGQLREGDRAKGRAEGRQAAGESSSESEGGENWSPQGAAEEDKVRIATDTVWSENS